MKRNILGRLCTRLKTPLPLKTSQKSVLPPLTLFMVVVEAEYEGASMSGEDE